MSASTCRGSSARNQLEDFLKHHLPTQGAIQDFIHHNTLHAYQHLPFDKAVAHDTQWTGGQGFLDRAVYREMRRAGKISNASLAFALSARTEPGASVPKVEAFLARQATLPARQPRKRPAFQEAWGRETQHHLEVTILPSLFRILALYLDQGAAHWQLPDRNLPWWTCLQHLILQSAVPHLWLREAWVLETLALDAPEALERLTHRLFGASLRDPGSESSLFPYILESLLKHPGWSGMVAMTTTKPQSFPNSQPIALMEWVTTTLLCEAEAILKVGQASLPMQLRAVEPPPAEHLEGLEIWQHATEWEFHRPLLAKLRPAPAGVPRRRPSAQFLHCIDDRECSLRRHLESQDADVETFSAAGFFGMDFQFQAWNQRLGDPRCPVHITPEHVVRETVLETHPAPASAKGNWGTELMLSPWALLKLVHHVWWSPLRLKTPEPSTRLSLFRETDAAADASGLLPGFTDDELARRVAAILRSTGFVAPYAPWIVVLGHGAHTSNNPHFAAYDCGACSGRPGGPNARAFAMAANRPEVRALLRTQGIDLPDDTVFVGAQHNTTEDEIHFYDDRPSNPLPDVVIGVIQRALRLNAQERGRRFELLNPALPPERAHQAVRERAFALFEPRPELNHATNALAIVGRRSLTQAHFLDRRAFLHSYDPHLDPDGTLLGGILSAVIPVCGGINLEYYFSRVSPDVHGAGSKLPHNVTSLLGVAFGVDSDLVNGLPTQMTEIHDPYRLMVIVEQSPDTVRRVLEQKPAIFEWVAGRWVHLACVDPMPGPTFGSAQVWTANGWKPIA